MSNNFLENPIFIIGNPRSGTTLLQLLLTSNPEIFIPTECGFMIHLYDKYKYFKFDKEIVLEFIDDVVKCKKFELWKLNKNSLLQYCIARKPNNYKELSSCVYEYYGKINYPNCTIWGDKNNYYLNYIKDINKIFPNARFIHIIRDGRDVACSYKDMYKLKDIKYAPNLPTNIEDIANEWKNNICTIRESFNYLNWNNVLEIRYEDLVKDKNNTLKEICNFLEINYTNSMLDFYKYNLEKELVPKEFDAWKSMNKSEINTSRLYRWKKELTKEEIKLFESICIDVLTKYKYKLMNY